MDLSETWSTNWFIKVINYLFKNSYGLDIEQPVVITMKDTPLLEFLFKEFYLGGQKQKKLQDSKFGRQVLPQTKEEKLLEGIVLY